MAQSPEPMLRPYCLPQLSISTPPPCQHTLINKVHCEDVIKDTGCKVQSRVASVRSLPLGGLLNPLPQTLYKPYQLYPSIYAHMHNLPGRPDLCLPRTQWAGLWLANGASFLRDRHPDR